MAKTTISALVCTYAGDVSAHLERSIRSLENQSRSPDEIVVVEDGPLTNSLYKALDKLGSTGDIPVRRITLPENVGQGAARREAVEQATGDLVAIHDADDIAVPERLERSLGVIERTGADLVGGYIAEFEDDPDDTYNVRTVPCEPEAIRTMAKSRSPVNQTTVLARRDAILEAGNYRAVERMEDYELWVRMLTNGHELRNLPTVLAKVRAGTEMYGRRGGFTYAREELRLQRYFRKLGFITRQRAVGNVLARAGIRFLPNQVRGMIYETVFRE
jgi:glycosyltransferase involved in cell wall biosynthesis